MTSTVDLTEIDRLLDLARQTADAAKNLVQPPDMASLSSLSRAYSALASVHLQHLAAIHAVEQSRLQDERWRAIESAADEAVRP